eukprot:m.1332878 g.1332878  ORF g.1332878 m.1332878 type:complete len:122 (+) comp24869_c0_seq27:215-580(+)
MQRRKDVQEWSTVGVPYVSGVVGIKHTLGDVAIPRNGTEATVPSDPQEQIIVTVDELLNSRDPPEFGITTPSRSSVDVQLFSVFKWDGNTGALEVDVLETDFLECACGSLLAKRDAYAECV